MQQQKYNDKVSGLDMGPTIAWYEGNKDIFSGRLGALLQGPKKDLQYPMVNPANIQLYEDDIAALVNLFPQNTIQRSILESIVGQPETWFHKDFIQEQPETTTDINQSISPTAIVPSKTDYSKWTEGKPSADIWLYKITERAASPEVRRIILAEGFLHEFGGHTLIAPAFNVPEYSLQLPNGKVVDAFDYLSEFGTMAENHPPISHYASAYRGRNNKFESDNQKYNPIVAISEELSEAIAAYHLGFAFCKDDARGKNPFSDRPEIRKFVEDFLNAKLISSK